ncbi:MAG: helix-turn-helix domain-containing protein [Spirochaetes bacterium]|nr:helix-turn-helix domain-containing protein [Spirochaetota bacterium]
MKLIPMKVLLVHRGEPFSFPRMGASSLAPPFIFVQADWRGPEGGLRTLPKGYSAYVLPCPLYHDLGKTDRPALCLVYGEPDDALACMESGAVDFLREGWNLHELGARLYRLWRPEFEVSGALVSMRGESLYLIKSSDRQDPEASVDLTPGGAAFLRTLLAYRNSPVPARVLEEASGRADGNFRSLPMQISRLRSRLSTLEPSLGRRIRSCGGGTYCLYTDEGSDAVTWAGTIA